MTIKELKFLEDVKEALYNCTINDHLFENNFDYCVANPLAAALENKYVINTAYGATKGVIIPLDNEINIVVKIPFYGEGDEGEFFNEDTGEYEIDEDAFFEYYGAYFESADTYINFDGNYCALEEYIYNYCAEKGLAGCLAKTEKVFEINDVPVYIQEKAFTISEMSEDEYERRSSSHSDEEKQYAEDNITCEINPMWTCDAIEYAGEQVIKELMQLLEDIDCSSDLRNCNIGYIGERPVLIDYCGYRS
jgi:hypothetical protein